MRTVRRAAAGAAVSYPIALALAALVGLAVGVTGCGDNLTVALDAGHDDVMPPDSMDGDAGVDTLPPFALDPARVFADVTWLSSPDRQGRASGTAGSR